MDIKENETFLLIKINTPSDVDFYNEHKKIIDKVGYTWFCKFGKTNLKFDRLNENKKYIFLKDTSKNNNNVYLIKFETITTDAPKENYPTYYNLIDSRKTLWFKITELKKVSYKYLIDNFLTISSNSNLEKVFKSMCNSFYIYSKSNNKIKEE